MADESERVVFAFGQGEVAPNFAARSDVEKLSTACRSVQNMTLGVFGYAQRRQGMQFIERVKTPSLASPSPSPSPEPEESPIPTLGSNPVLQPGPSMAWEQTAVYEPSVLFEEGVFRMWYGGGWDDAAIGYAESSDGSIFSKDSGNPVLGQGGSSIAGHASRNNILRDGTVLYCYYADAVATGANLRRAYSSDGLSWTGEGVVLAHNVNANADGWASTAVWIEGSTWYMLAEGHTAGGLWNIFALTSANGLSWTFLNSGNPLTTLRVAVGGMWGGPCVPIHGKVGGLYHVWYHASPGAGTLPTDIYHATSPDLVTWTIDGTVPILEHDQVNFEMDQVADPWLVEAGGRTYLYYSGMDNDAEAGVLGLAVFDGTLTELATLGGDFVRIDLEAARQAGAAPVAGWNMAEASGTRADAVNDYDLTANGTITTGAGVGATTAAEMTGSEHLSRATEYAIQLGNFDFTFAGWFYMSDNTAFSVVLTKYTGGSQQQIYVYLEPTAIRFLLYPALTNTGQQELYANNHGAIANNTWVFVALWHDAVNDTMNISVNNGTANSVAYATGINPQGTAPLRLGGDGSSNTATRRMQRWGYWKRILSGAERTALYNAGSGVDF